MTEQTIHTARRNGRIDARDGIIVLARPNAMKVSLPPAPPGTVSIVSVAIAPMDRRQAILQDSAKVKLAATSITVRGAAHAGCVGAVSRT